MYYQLPLDSILGHFGLQPTSSHSMYITGIKVLENVFSSEEHWKATEKSRQLDTTSLDIQRNDKEMKRSAGTKIPIY